MNLMFYLAIERIPLGIAVALEFTGPLAVALLSSKRKLDLLWVALAMAGIGLLLPWQTEATALDPLGVALALGAGACWAGYIIFGQKTGGALHGGTAVALGMAVAALFLFPIGLVSAGSTLLAGVSCLLLLPSRCYPVRFRTVWRWWHSNVYQRRVLVS